MQKKLVLPMHDFYRALSSLQQQYYNLYKSNDNGFVYRMNDALRRGFDVAEFDDAIRELDGLIALNPIAEEMDVYRATFDANVAPFIQNGIYNNPEYLSVAIHKDAVIGHFTQPNDPALLIFSCEAGMCLAPMEGNALFDDSEKEYLMGRNNSFRVEERKVTTEKAEIEAYMGRFYARDVKHFIKYRFQHIV
jgi:hypothetical protein